MPAADTFFDTNVLLYLLSDDAVIDLGGDLALVGHESVRGLHEWEHAMATEIHYSGCEVAERTVTCRATEQNDFLRLAGLPDITGSPGAYALVGMGTAFAGIVRAPMTSVIMIFEITRDYSIIVPVMIANLLSYFISQRLGFGVILICCFQT